MKNTDITKTLPQILESEVTIKFQIDLKGNFETSLRCSLESQEIQQTLDRVLNAFIRSLSGAGWPVGHETTLDFTMQLWVLDDDGNMLSTELIIGAVEFIESKDAIRLEQICNDMIGKVQPRFLQSIARHDIEFD